jgi:hypothetical protein
VTGALLHRYCPDHSPSTALCGADLAGLVELPDEAREALDSAEEPEPGSAGATARSMPACVVCSDLSPMACIDACIGARSEVA